MRIREIVDDDYIIEQIEAGATYQDLADHYGIKAQAMAQYCICRGYSYKNRGHITKVEKITGYMGDVYKECPNCHKIYNCYNVNEWAYSFVYRNQKLYFCGWNCMRNFEKEKGIE